MQEIESIRPVKRAPTIHRGGSAPIAGPSLEEILAAGAREGSILLVEDEPEIRQFFRWALEREGYRTHATCDGAECLRLARTLRPGLIVLNNLMPVMDGLTALRHLKKDPVTSYLKVLMYSGVWDFARFRAAALEAGAVDCLQTPFDLKTLIQAVDRSLRR
jgi:CheY-like chemotaxis protein